MIPRNAPTATSHPTQRVPQVDRPMMGIANLDRTLIVRQANQDFVTQFHQSTDAIYGHSIYDLIHPSVHAQVQQDFGKLMDGKAHRFVCRMIALAPRNSTRPGELAGTVVRDETNRVAGITVLVRLDPNAAVKPAATAEKPVLSKIDALILEGIAAGASTMQLAGQLHLSRQGVEYHVSAMLRKLDAANRTALVSKAHSLGLLRLDVWPPIAVSEFIS